MTVVLLGPSGRRGCPVCLHQADRFSVTFPRLISTIYPLWRSSADEISVPVVVPSLWYATNAALACAMLGAAWGMIVGIT